MDQRDPFPGSPPATVIEVDEDEYVHFMQVMANPKPPTPTLLAGAALLRKYKPRSDSE